MMKIQIVTDGGIMKLLILALLLCSCKSMQISDNSYVELDAKGNNGLMVKITTSF